MKYLFINYRRKDSRWAAILIYRRIIEKFGSSAAFLDTQKIDSGDKWPKKLENVLESASLLLMLVGDQWEESFCKKQNCGLEDDWVLRELQYAANNNIKIFPVLLDREGHPDLSQLPEAVRKVYPTDIQIFPVRISELDKDIDKLLDTLKNKEGFLELGRSYIETDCISAPKVWLKCNHSIPDIALGDIWNSDFLKSQAFLKRVLVGNFGITDTKLIQQIDEDSASLNFRVHRGKKERPVLLRIHKRLDTESAVSTLIRLQNLIADKFEELELFKKTYVDGLRQFHQNTDKPINVQTNEVLIGLFSESDRHYLSGRGVFHFEARFFIDDVRHFPGESLGQIKSVASSLGKLNKLLKEFNPDQLALVDDLNVSRKKLFDFFRGSDDLEHFKSDVDKMRYKEVEWMRLLAQKKYSKELFPPIYDLVNWSIKNYEKPAYPTVQDFHPHNCFFRLANSRNERDERDKCVLIYDFEAVGTSWPREASLAFAIHRFTREYQRRNPREGDALDKAVKAFIAGYATSGDDVPDFSNGSLAKWIKIVNMCKLIALFCEEHYGESRNPRKPTTIHDEAMKFLSFLEEANYYEGLKIRTENQKT